MSEVHSPGSTVLLTRVARLIYRRASEERLGMRFKDVAALSYLRDLPGTPQRQLGDALMIDANYCVLLLNDLEAAGYVERRRDPADRRRHIVDITPAGVQALERAERALDGLEDEVLGPLAAEDRELLRELLGRVLAGTSVPA
jgi:DNA-binding MarR family transcriptional regulator